MNKVKKYLLKTARQLRHSLGGSSRQQHAARMAILGSVLLIFGVTLLPLFQNDQALAAFVQNDWSGGVGTNPENQYDSASNITVNGDGHLTGGASVNTWCNTTNCDNNWSVRKPVYMGFSGATPTIDTTLRLTVEKDTGMQADFDDLRFTNAAGDQDLTHYVLNKTDDQSATVLILLPANSLPMPTLYMYYLNDSAASVSNEYAVMGAQGYSKSDDGNNTLSSRWDSTYSDPPATITQVSGNKVQAELSTGFDYFNYNNSIQAIAPLTMEVSFARTPGPGQGENCNHGLHNFTSGVSLLEFQFGCDEQGEFWRTSLIQKMGNTTYPLPEEESPKIRNNEEVWFRVDYKSDGTVDISFSRDNGQTYQSFSGPSGAGSGQFVELRTAFTGPTTITFGDLIVYSPPADATTAFGTNQYLNGYYGELNSVPINLGDKYELGDVSYNYQDGGIAAVKIRTGDNSSMSGATDFAFCPFIYLENGASAPAQNECVDTSQPYLQYQVILSTDSNRNVFNDITIEYIADNEPPTVNASNLTITSPERDGWPAYQVPDGGWIFDSEDTAFSWNAAEDDAEGSGIKGYCLYLGSDPEGDPVTTGGVLTFASGSLDTDGACVYAFAGTEFTFSQLGTGVSPGDQSYLNIKAIDNFNNVYSGESAQTSFRLDETAPDGFTSFSGPQGYINSKTFTINWQTGFPFEPPEDSGSGVAGLKYCITNATLGFEGCFESGENWYGTDHSSGNIHDTSDVLDFNTTQYTTQPSDFNRLDDNGVNVFYFVFVDNVGNFRFMGSTAVLISQSSPSVPTNLQVTPTSSNQNSFSFTWQPPASLVGPASQVDYCWTVNEVIAGDGSNCHWTGKGITQLAAGAYATQQGVNTLRLIAKNQAGNFNANLPASVNFTTNTPAPGPPENVDIADVSTRATSAWKLALAWNAPGQVGGGLSQYRIYRSIDNLNFAQVGTTSPSNTSFIDSGLSQVDYYYYIKACDNADSCSAASNVVTKKPTGRFTSPPKLTADTDQPKVRDISTRRATVFWFTDRESDSRVAFGTKPGQYEPQEIGNSALTSNHVVNLVNLQPGTKYYYIAKWTDQDGNTGQSIERSFTTAPAPEVSEVEPSRLSIADATIGFSSQYASRIRLFYGRTESFGQVVELNTSFEKSRYELNLPNLTDGTRYYYKINSFDSEANEYQGNIYSFTTPARPLITNLRFQPVEGEPSSTQKISWNTNVPASSELLYGVRGEPQVDVVRSELVTNHEVIISNLNDASIYTLVARSRDAAGNLAVSDLQTFPTSLDTRPPKISEVKVEVKTQSTGPSARGQLIVSWKTDEASTSQVAYGPGQAGPYTAKSASDGRLTKEHVVVLSDLEVSSIYHLQVLSKDKAGNEGRSANRSVIVGRGNENVFSIIFKALQQILGV